jgi:large subunit ribosomal protein L10
LKASEKAEIVAALRERLSRARIMILASPKGLTVGEATDLRRKMRAQTGEYKIAKNTLMRRAVEETVYASITPLLEGQTALVLGYEDPVAIAKAVVGYAKDSNEKILVRGGVLDGALLTADDVQSLAKLESMDQLRAKLLGLMQAPAQRLVRLLSEPGASLARALSARGESGAPAPE